ncbi:MAG: hypothetical protein ACREUL_09540 [Steroidobacteraceae bacterium]
MRGQAWRACTKLHGGRKSAVQREQQRSCADDLADDQTLPVRGGDSLPVQAVVKNNSVTAVISYSKYNEPITVEVPAS